MLTHICRYAERQKIKSIESIESRENHSAIELERDMGFKALDYDDDPTLVLLRRELSVADA